MEMKLSLLILVQFVLKYSLLSCSQSKPIIVVSTWPFTKATDAAWEVLTGTVSISGKKYFGTAINAVVAGCTDAEEDRDIQSVGYGCSPDEEGHTTLDALVMDGNTMEVGAVAAMPYIRNAAQIAREVLFTTKHSMIVGLEASIFAITRGYAPESLDTEQSRKLWNAWKARHCQPNYRESSAWSPNPLEHCGPYRPTWAEIHRTTTRPKDTVDEQQHDTIGMIAIDADGSMAVGLSTSGAIHKIPGRVGDTPIPGSGGYVDTEVGGAVGTGDGDVLMRFSLSFQAVWYMRQGLIPQDACKASLKSVKQKGSWSGALVALSATGRYGAACVGFEKFQFTVRSAETGNSSVVITVECK